jgi:recombination protein RecT
MSRQDIDGIMNRSQSVKSGKSSPWKTDWGEMAKKTVVKRAYKYWPKTERLDSAVHHLNTESGEGLAILESPPRTPARAALPPPADSPERDALYASLQDIATGGMDAYAQAWAALTKEQRSMIGQQGHEALKAGAEKAIAEVVE